MHVTLRVKEHVWNLRSRRSFRRIRRAFEKARGRFGARLIEYSVQGNHLHLILEADDNDALSRAMQGLCIRLAKALNALMSRAGRVFDDHYFGRLLKSPTELTRAIAYVLGNHQRHFGGSPEADAYSSATLSQAERVELLSFPVGWLLRVGRLGPPADSGPRIGFLFWALRRCAAPLVRVGLPPPRNAPPLRQLSGSRRR